MENITHLHNELNDLKIYEPRSTSRPILRPDRVLEIMSRRISGPEGRTVVGKKKVTSNGPTKKQVLALKENICFLASKFGLENMIFMTLTVPGPVTPFEISQKLNRMNRPLRQKFSAWVRVTEQGKNGRWHTHLIAVLAKNLQGVPEAVKTEHVFWTRKARGYGFGRIDLRPVTDPQGLSSYLSKSFGKQDSSCRKTRRITYSQGWRIASDKFSWCRGIARVYRQNMKKLLGEDTGAPVGHALSFLILQQCLKKLRKN